MQGAKKDVRILPLSDKGIIESQPSLQNSQAAIVADGSISVRSSIARLQTFKKRSDFVRMNKSADYIAKHGFVIQYMTKKPPVANAVSHHEANPTIRIGYTASKKIGNAVIRNKSKRRLRQLARMHLVQLAEKNMDYVLIARKETAHADFAEMKQKFTRAIKHITAQSG